MSLTRPEGQRPDLSIIVPVYNGARTLKACLAAIETAPGPKREVVVVNDASQDASADIASAAGAVVVRNDVNRGVAFSRNLGVEQTSSPVLVFVDCDVVLHGDALERISDFLSDHHQYSAIFGSYDAEPAARTFVSQYRNLLHHFTHQEGKHEAETFWAGLGAVRRSAFCSVGGFRSEKDGLEDVDLGLRLRDAGFRIYLDHELLGAHLKSWSLGNMVITDTFSRAKVWSSLVLERGRFTNTLNTTTANKIGVLSAMLAVGTLPLLALSTQFIYLTLASAFVNSFSNLRIYQRFALTRGLLFSLGAVPLQFVHQLCAGTGFILALKDHIYNYASDRTRLARFFRMKRE